jgi:N,N'-diacetylchitobiose phosphorylase
VVSICEYVKETGEVALFDEIVPFADEGEATVFELSRAPCGASPGKIPCAAAFQAAGADIALFG